MIIWGVHSQGFSPILSLPHIYIHIIILQELGYLNIYCNSEFHASCEAIIRQLPEITVTITGI